MPSKRPSLLILGCSSSEGDLWGNGASGLLGQKNSCPQISLHIQIINWNPAEESLFVCVVSCWYPLILDLEMSLKRKMILGQSNIKSWCSGLHYCGNISEALLFKNTITQTLKSRFCTDGWGRVYHVVLLKGH